MMHFELHPNLQKKILITDLELCSVLLEDEKHYPWLLLVPRRVNVGKIMDLREDDQLLLLRELDRAQNIVWELFKPFQLNVAAIGNKTPQLHVHVIGRFQDDPAWPATVWDHTAKEKYQDAERNRIVERLQAAFAEN